MVPRQLAQPSFKSSCRIAVNREMPAGSPWHGSPPVGLRRERLGQLQRLDTVANCRRVVLMLLEQVVRKVEHVPVGMRRVILAGLEEPLEHRLPFLATARAQRFKVVDVRQSKLVNNATEEGG